MIYKSGDSYFVATLTVQTVQGDNQTYIKDADTIIRASRSFRRTSLLYQHIGAAEAFGA